MGNDNTFLQYLWQSVLLPSFNLTGNIKEAIADANAAVEAFKKVSV